MLLFQNNPSISQELFGIPIEVSFPALVALIIFLVGLITQWLGKRINKWRKDKTIRTFILTQLHILLEAIDKQAKNIQKYIDLLNEEKVQNLEFELRTDFTTKHISVISEDKLFDLYVMRRRGNKQKRIEIYNKMLKCLDLISSLKEQFIESFNYTQKHLDEYQKVWNNNIEKIGDFHDYWGTKLGVYEGGLLADPFLDLFFSKYHELAKAERYTDMHIAVPILINPLLEEIKKPQPGELHLDILRPLLKGQDALKNYRNLSNIKIDEFSRYKTQLENIKKDLEIIIDTIH